MNTLTTATAPAPGRDFPRAFLEHDLAGLEALLTDDVVLRSPIISTPFEGRDEVALVVRAARDAFEDLAFDTELEAGDTLALWFRARIGRQSVRGTDLIRLHDDGRIREFTIFVRPLAAVVAVAAALGGPVAGKRGRLNAILVRALIAPLVLATRAGDRFASLLTLGRHRPSL